MLEKELQSKIYQLLKSTNIADFIYGIELYRSKADSAIDQSFTIKNILSNRYTESVLSIYEKFETAEYEVIGAESPKNMSLDRNDRLYPDFIVHDYEHNFFVFELKVISS